MVSRQQQSEPLFWCAFSYKWHELCFLIVIFFQMDIVNEMAHMHHGTLAAYNTQ